MHIFAYGQFDATGTGSPYNSNIGVKTWVAGDNKVELSFYTGTETYDAADVYPIVTFVGQPSNHTWSVDVECVSGTDNTLTIYNQPQEIRVILIHRSGYMA